MNIFGLLFKSDSLLFIVIVLTNFIVRSDGANDSRVFFPLPDDDHQGNIQWNIHSRRHQWPFRGGVLGVGGTPGRGGVLGVRGLTLQTSPAGRARMVGRMA